jgi:ATP-binding cassette subfamily B protein
MSVTAGLKLVWALRLVWDSGPGWAVATLALVGVQGAIPLLALYLMKLVVDTLAANLATADPGIAFGQVAPRIGLTDTVALVGTLCQALARLVREAQAQAVTDHIHDLLHAKSTEVDLEYYENSRYYDALHRAQQEASLRPTLILNGIVRVSESGISLLAMAALLFSFHWMIVAILFAAAVPGLLVRFKHGATLYRWQRSQTPAERQARYLNAILTGDGHAKELRLLALGPLFRQRFRQVRTQLRRQRLSMVTRRAVAEFLSQASALLAIFGALGYMVYRTVQGSITLGELVMYYQAFQRGQGFLREMLNGLTGLYEHHLFLADLSEFLGLTSTVVEPVLSTLVPCPMHAGIVFDHVSFQYPGSQRPVLRNITLTIRPREVVALVGANGSGKTTRSNCSVDYTTPRRG